MNKKVIAILYPGIQPNNRRFYTILLIIPYIMVHNGRFIQDPTRKYQFLNLNFIEDFLLLAKRVEKIKTRTLNRKEISFSNPV